MGSAEDRDAPIAASRWRSFVCFWRGHKWSEPVSESAIFQRIDCLRCGIAVDGAKLREVKRVLDEMGRTTKGLP